MKEQNPIEVVRHGLDKQGDPFTSTYQLSAAENGELRLARLNQTHPPKPSYTPEEFVDAGFHLKAECPSFKDGKAIHLRDDFDGDFDAIPDCPHKPDTHEKAGDNCPTNYRE